MTERVERQVIEEAKAKMLEDLDDRRRAVGMVDLSEFDAELRARALDQLTPEQFTVLLALPEEQRFNQIRALEDGQRRAHAVAELRQVAISILDGRALYRWRCACGAEAPGDYFSAEEVRNAWGRHAGLVAEGSTKRQTVVRKEPSWRTTERLYYRERLANVELLADAVEISWLEQLAVPIGGQRRGGFVCGDDEPCRRAMSLLANRPGFPNLRFVPSGSDYVAQVEWGDEIPAPEAFDRDGWTWACGKLYGYTDVAITKHLQAGWH